MPNIAYFCAMVLRTHCTGHCSGLCGKYGIPVRGGGGGWACGLDSVQVGMPPGPKEGTPLPTDRRKRYSINAFDAGSQAPVGPYPPTYRTRPRGRDHLRQATHTPQAPEAAWDARHIGLCWAQGAPDGRFPRDRTQDGGMC